MPTLPSLRLVRLTAPALWCALASSLALTASAQSIVVATLSENGRFVQTSNSTAVLQGANFEATIFGSDLSGVTGSFVVPSGTLSGTTQNLAYDSSDGSVRFSSNNFVNANALSAAYGAGNYQFNVNGTTLPSTFGMPSSASSFLPNIPLGVLSQGTVSNGFATVNISQSLTISTNTFTSNYQSGHGLVLLSISGPGVNMMIGSAPGFNSNGYNYDQNQLSFTLPAFSMTSGAQYEVIAQFLVLVDTNSTQSTMPATLGSPDLSSLSGATVFSSISRETSFTINAIPEPSATAAAAAGAALAFVAWRRRKVSLVQPA